LLPYHVKEARADGVVLTLTDITESKQSAEARLAEQKAQAAALEKGIAERTSQLRELSVALNLTEERERRSIAVDLHDDLGQVLALLKMRLDVMLPQVPKGPMTEELQSACTLLAQASRRVRSLAFQLSPAILYELGLVPALEWLGDEMEGRYSLSVDVEADDGARGVLDPVARTVLFRATRELLINVGKHSGTDHAHVVCRCVDHQLVITVADGGRGFDAEKTFAMPVAAGFGLLSIRERLAGIGGTVEVSSIPGEGCKVTLQVPNPTVSSEARA
jgi:signal transduction histidine kinase